MAAYSQSAIEDIQARWRLRFPPDLTELMLRRRPLIAGGFDWLRAPTAEIQRMLSWPLEGLWFDVCEDDLWWPAWGDKPVSRDAQRAVLEGVLARAPRLIPLTGHSYLPERPSGRGNPVFSVYQSDIIYYGVDLEDWLVREQGGGMPTGQPREIPFWSEAVRRNA